MASSFAARYAIERRQWRDALALDSYNRRCQRSVNNVLGTPSLLADLHDPAAAQEALKTYEGLLEQVKTGPWAYLLDRLKDEHEEVRAWVAYAEGKNEDAIRLLGEVAGRQDKIGKGESDLPAREMLADMLLESGLTREALGEYEISLKTDPNRFNGLYGAAQAAEKLHQKKKAEGYDAQLLKNCEGVDSDRAELVKAKTLLAAK